MKRRAYVGRTNVAFRDVASDNCERAGYAILSFDGKFFLHEVERGGGGVLFVTRE